jgi:hypothetical protein
MAKHLAAVRLREAGFRQTTAPLPRAGPHPKVTKREEATGLSPAHSGSHSVSVPVVLYYWNSLAPIGPTIRTAGLSSLVLISISIFIDHEPAGPHKSMVSRARGTWFAPAPNAVPFVNPWI